jgi:UDP-N-acetylmuramate--alanine ligase
LKHIHLIGIGGSGLSAIARVLNESGYKVSGSDRLLSPMALSLREAGVCVYEGHHPDYVLGADLVVRSSAIPDDNVEVIFAEKIKIPVLKRSEFLGQLFEGKKCIATTTMIAWMLKNLGLDPSYIIGGVSTDLGGNAHAGTGPYFVIEADEYDNMFLGLHPLVAVVTNIEHDHPDCFPTPESYMDAFRQFASQIEENGVLVAYADELGSNRLLLEMAEQGIGTRAYHSASPENDEDIRTAYELLDLQVPGAHNKLNALAALTVAKVLGLSLDRAVLSLNNFQGVGRRFELRGEVSGVMVIDDYAHHPTEIKATLEAARSRFPDQRIWAVWQPHTYSRTRQLLHGFAGAFSEADIVVITDIYAARETPPEDGFSSSVVAEMINASGSGTAMAYYIPGLHQVQEFLIDRLVPGDILLVLSAGDADSISTGVLAEFIDSSKVL